MRQNDVFGITTIQYSVGLSALQKVTPYDCVVSVNVQHISGGTLTVVGLSSFTADGFHVASGSPLTLGGPTTFWLKSTGATTVVQVLMGLNAQYNLTQGGTITP